MIQVISSLLADVMLFGSVPLMMFVLVWEGHFRLSTAEHDLAEMFLVVLVFSWAYLWYSIGERQRMMHEIKKIEQERKLQSTQPVVLHYREMYPKTGNDRSKSIVLDTFPVEVMERHDVSNN